MKGTVWKFEDNVNTDVIIPARYLNVTDPEKLAKHCMEDIDKEFAKKVKKGDIIIAGENFGCGSSREHAPIAIKACGVRCVVAKSFARIFFRNAINIGLPVIDCKEVFDNVKSGESVEIDIVRGTVQNVNKKKTFDITPFPKFLQKIISAGGLVNYTKDMINWNSLGKKKEVK